MSYTALYRKWRPLVFEDVVEQSHVVRTLKNTVKSDRIGHAYLFCGTRGTGKTTMAKIFARAINCLDPHDGDPCNKCEICRGILEDTVLDVVEIDAASNNSVDNVREIREEVVYAPSQSRYKVYIIDEVHMLSSGAFNALLKTLEEPPSHVVFILATTDPHKLPATILSRCQRFDFKKITQDSIAERIKYVTAQSGLNIDEDAAQLIAKLADGAMRDALSILDQCIAVGGSQVTHQSVLDIVGIVSDDFIADLVEDIKNCDVAALVKGVESLSSNGRDILKFASDLVIYFRNLLICKLSDNPGNIIEYSKEYVERMIEQSKAFDKTRLIGIITELSSMESQLKYALNQRVFLEVVLISISTGSYGQGEGNVALMDRIANLEQSMRSGMVATVNPGLGGAPFTMAGQTVSNLDSAQTNLGGASLNVSSNLADNSNVAGNLNIASHSNVAGNLNIASHSNVAGNSNIASHSNTAGNTNIAASINVATGISNSVANSQDKKASSKKNKAEIEELPEWPKVMEELRGFRRMSLVAYLATAKAVALDDTTIMIIFPDNAPSLKDNVSKADNAEVIETILGKLLGRAVRIKTITQGDFDEINMQAAPKVKKEDESQLLKYSREIANRANVPLDIIEE